MKFAGTVAMGVGILVLAACAGQPPATEAASLNAECQREKPFGSHISQPRCKSSAEKERNKSAVKEHEDATRRLHVPHIDR